MADSKKKPSDSYCAECKKSKHYKELGDTACLGCCGRK